MKKKRGKRHGERYVGLPHYLLKSPAYLSLPSDAVKILLAIWVRYNGVNNGEISFGVREAEEVGISKTVTSRMLAILVDRGFLSVARLSTFNPGTKAARSWRLTTEPYRGEPATKDYMRWRAPLIEAAGIVVNVPPQGLKTPSKNQNPVPPQGHLSPSPGTRAIKLHGLVPPQGLNCPETPRVKSLPRDTYIGTRWDSASYGAAPLPRGCHEWVPSGVAGTGCSWRHCGAPVGDDGQFCDEHAARRRRLGVR